MTDTTPRAGAPLLGASQAQKHVTHNEALYQFDAFLCTRFLDRDLSTPSSPADGDTYLVKATGTDAWAGQDGKIAYCADGGWRFYAPFVGLVAYVADETALVVFNGLVWADYGSLMSLQNVPQVGVNTAANSINRLSVQSNVALFSDVPTSSGGSGDMRVTLSKQAATNTASLLFQDNFSGRAEIGLLGDDDFHLKVSPDGTAWTDALQISAMGGTVTLPSVDINGGTADSVSIGTTARGLVNCTVLSGNLQAINETEGSTNTVGVTARTVLFTSPTTRTNVTLQLRQGIYDGEELEIGVGGAGSITNLTINPTGADSIAHAPSTLVAGKRFSAVYRTVTSTWYCFQ